MKLNEYQTLSLLSRFHVPVASCFLVKTADEIEPLLMKHELNKGVVQAEDKKEFVCLTQEDLRKALGSFFASQKSQQVLVRPSLVVEYELYLAITLDRKTKEHVVLAARGRKSDPDENGRSFPLGIYREVVFTGKKLYTFQKTGLFYALDLPENMRPQYFQIIDRLLSLYFAYDATLVELNPIAVTYPMKMLVSHASMVIDPYALFRQPEMNYFFDKNRSSSKEDELSKRRIFYGTNGGSIGILAMGKELLQAIIDIFVKSKASIGSFVAIDEEGDEESLSSGLKALLDDKSNCVLFVNIFHGLKSSDRLAKAFISSLKNVNSKKIPIVLRVEAAGVRGMKEIIESVDWPIHLVSSFEEAVALTVTLNK